MLFFSVGVWQELSGFGVKLGDVEDLGVVTLGLIGFVWV
jgi:hypothetical protein